MCMKFYGMYDIVRNLFSDVNILDYDIDMNGTPEQQLAVYETPFLIWQNDAAKEMGAINTEDVVMPENMTINANYLGALLLEYMGYVDATE